MIDPFGFVHLRGLVALAGGGNATLGFLPPEATPAYQQIFDGIGSYAGGQVNLRVDVYGLNTPLADHGRIYVQAASGVAWTGAYMSLAGIPPFQAANPPTKVLAGPKGEPGAAAGLLSYTEITAAVAVTATTLPSAQLILASNAIDCDGSPIEVEFFAPYIAPALALGAYMHLTLWQDSTDIGILTLYEAQQGSVYAYAPVCVKRRLTPAAGSHTFSIRAVAAGGTPASVGAGVGTAGNYVAAYLKVSKG
jgi:hypothetical protein